MSFGFDYMNDQKYTYTYFSKLSQLFSAAKESEL